MKTLTVAEVKTNFSDILVQVKNGEKVKILYGKSKEPIAMIIPLADMKSHRKIGILDGIAPRLLGQSGKI
jgi:antitoxin (DNA-binding transcriptional repressor) of toxin-antitoxin stability system